MRKVRCPRCSAITPTKGNHVKCARCGLQGRVGDAPPGPQGAPAKDPFVITIDLRKLSPTNWGRGAKALAAATILLGAFFLGGFAGVAFEKARTDLGEDLERGESLLGGSSNESDASGSSSQSDLASGDGSTGGALASGDASASGDGKQSTPEESSNSTAGNTTAGNATDPPDDPPENPPNDNYGDGDAPPPFEFEGTERGRTDAFLTEQDLILVEVEFYGDAFFSLHVCSVDASCAKASDAAAVISAQDYGNYIHDRTFSVPAGEYEINVKSEGTWTVTVRQPQPADGSAPVGIRSDNGDGVRGPLDFRGTYTVGFGANGHGSVAVQAYLLNGTAVPDCSFSGTAAGDDDPYAGSRTCVATGLVYFDISAPKRSDTQQSWALDIKEA